MKINHSWLAEYFGEKIPEALVLSDLFNAHSYEIESIENFNDIPVLEVKILPNRAADSLCHRGVAKELSVLSGLTFKDREIKELATEETDLEVQIESPSKCVRYIGQRIKNIEIKDSPEWLKQKLASLGQRSINNVVDVLNFVMFDVGQPMHAFDADKVVGKIIIRDAAQSESITTLDGKVFNLEPGDLLISDEEGILAIAGVKGGIRAEVTRDTKNIILESANFTQTAIRKTSRRLQLLTDASKRYEGALPPEIADFAMKLAVSHIVELSGTTSTIVEGAVDILPKRRNQYKLGVSINEINKLLGTNLESSEVEDIWSRFGFKYQKVHPLERVVNEAKEFIGTPYKFGASISYDAPKYFDCSSFVAYLYASAGVSLPRMTIDQYVYGTEISLEDIEVGDVVYSQTSTDDSVSSFEPIQSGQTLVDSKGPVSQKDVHFKTIEFLPGTVVANGVSHSGLYLGNGEIIHASGKWHKGEVVVEKMNESPAFKNIRGVRRFATDEERYVIDVPFERQDLRIKEDLIEEIGRVYGLNQIKPRLPKILQPKKINAALHLREKIRDIATKSGFDEVYNYSFAKRGEVKLLNPLSKEAAFMRSSLEEGIVGSLEFNIKNAELLDGQLIKLFEIGKVFNNEAEKINFSAAAYFKGKPKTIAKESLDDLVKELSETFPSLQFNIVNKNERYFCEVELDSIINQITTVEKYEFSTGNVVVETINLSNFPFILRDVAVWVRGGGDKNTVESVIAQEGGEWLVRKELFDEFQKDNRVSLAYHLVFQANDRTLTDSEINEIMDRIYTKFKEKTFEIR